MLATGLFLLMVIVYVITTILIKDNDSLWLGYVRAFAEAGMVGALADWFAVTALFHKPMGLRIPHTNLIENSKQRIGNNLGNFVARNFLNPATIRPYIEKLHVSKFIAEWLGKEKHLNTLMHEAGLMATDLIKRMNDAETSAFIANKISKHLPEIPAHRLMAEGISFLLKNGEQENFVTVMSGKIKDYIRQNEGMVKSRVYKESYFFIPKFIDDKLSDKITKGLYNYFEEIEKNPEHLLRAEITAQLQNFTDDLQTNKELQQKIKTAMEQLAGGKNLERYSGYVWRYLKNMLLKELADPNSGLFVRLKASIQEYANKIRTDENAQQKIDGWLRFNAYRIILKNDKHVSDLISKTVGNWEGRELSNKLELEVGKDLQYIRINGTLVGGLVGLIIYTFTHLILK